jgi:hypothetical protein
MTEQHHVSQVAIIQPEYLDGMIAYANAGDKDAMKVMASIILWCKYVELDRIRDAAAMLPAEKRGQFLRVVANRLGDLQAPTPVDIELALAITSALSAHGIAVGRRALSKQRTDNLKKLRQQRPLYIGR